MWKNFQNKPVNNYQYFKNNSFISLCILKSRLQKLDGLNYENLKENINKEKYENIFKGEYEWPKKYIPRNITRKVRKYTNNYL